MGGWVEVVTGAYYTTLYYSMYCQLALGMITIRNKVVQWKAHFDGGRRIFRLCICVRIHMETCVSCIEVLDLG